MKYKILYMYEWWSLGCDCCTDSSSEVTITQDGVFVNSFGIALMENEDELREYMDQLHPEFKGFEVDPDSEWF